ncbi:MAG: hypothetical protein U9R24_06125, partial [Thermodesulfobacteriota bacterium]|nr:hypothetical protein [Thermodesulfobacteriota bacterium]
AALGSYILINVFFGYRFYRMYGRLSEKNRARHIRSLKREVENVWNEKLDLMDKGLAGFNEEISSRISFISGLKRNGFLKS